MPPRIVYTAGRAFGIVTRPLYLLIAHNFLTANIAEGLAVTMLASSLALVAVAAGPHRRFYARHFAKEPTVSGLNFYTYLQSVLILIVVGCVVVFGISVKAAASLSLAAVTCLYFASEKLADELLRLRLFERDFDAWGRASIARSSLQLFGLAVLLVVPVQLLTPWHLVVVLSLGNIAIFVPQLLSNLGANLWGRTKGLYRWLFYRAMRTLYSDRSLWMIALIGTLVGYLDRMLAFTIEKSALPIFTLIVMCFSILQMAVDFYYVSQNRRDILERRIDVFGAFRSNRFVVSFCVGLALSSLAAFATLFLSRGGSDFPLVYVASIAGLQIAVTIANIPREILYWSNLFNWILRIEIGFWAIFAVGASIAMLLGTPVVTILGLAVATVFVRLLLYVVMANKAVPAVGT